MNSRKDSRPARVPLEKEMVAVERLARAGKSNWTLAASAWTLNVDTRSDSMTLPEL